MSRVRILNLPQDCTEDKLRQHILHSATPTSPPLDITDVCIVRSNRVKRGRSASSHGNQRSGTSSSFSSSSSVLSGHLQKGMKALGPIRMAFVGFRSSAAAQFVVRHLNHTYLHSSKIAVELAKGLGEVGVTANMRKRVEAATNKSARESIKTAAALHSDDTTVKDAGKRGRASAKHSDNEYNDEEEEKANDRASAKQARRESFVSRRVQSTTGPAWAAEVLLPAQSAVSETAIAPEPTRTEPRRQALNTTTVHDGQLATSRAHREGSGAIGNEPQVVIPRSDDDNDIVVFDAEAEKRALQKQQELGGVDDMAFLSALATSNITIKSSAVATNNAAELTPIDEGRTNNAATMNGDGVASMRAPSLLDETTPVSSSSRTDTLEREAHAHNGSRKEANGNDEKGTKTDSNDIKCSRASSKKAKSISHRVNEREDDEASQESIAGESARIRVTGIPYIATEENVKQLASSCVGPVMEVHIPLTKDTKQSKGAAFVKFQCPSDAVRALRELHGKIFMGRIIRVAAAVADPYSQQALERAAQQGASATGTVGSVAGCSQLKLSKERLRREQQSVQSSSNNSLLTSQSALGSSTTAHANTLHGSSSATYMDSHAAVEAVAQRLAVRAEDVVGVQAGGAAVRAAIAEAYLAHEVQQVLGDEGIDLECLQSAEANLLKPRSKTTILVKNIQLAKPEDATELARLFVRYGVLESSAFPSAGVFALFRYAHAQDARIAFSRLSLKLFHNAPLYLEWAPIGASVDPEESEEDCANGQSNANNTSSSLHNNNTDTNMATALSPSATTVQASMGGSGAAVEAVFTLFITNLPFTTQYDDLHVFLQDACPRLARAPDRYIKRLMHQKEQGRAFLTVCDASTLSYCAAKLRGRSFQGRLLNCVVSKQTIQQQQQQRSKVSRKEPEAEAKSDRSVGMSKSQHSKDNDDTHEEANNADHHSHNNNEEDEDDDDTLSKTAAVNIVSSRTKTTSAVPAGCDPNKLIVKNLPFEATAKDVRELFSAFSEIRSVRVPRKSHTFASHRENNHRGFAFVEFLSEAEAARALAMLRSTHLYGRHLVLQYAKLDAS